MKVATPLQQTGTTELSVAVHEDGSLTLLKLDSATGRLEAMSLTHDEATALVAHIS